MFRALCSDNTCSKCSSIKSAYHLYASRNSNYFFIAKNKIDNYCSSVFSTNVASIFFVVVHFLSFGSEFGKRINHDTRNNVSEKETEKDKIDQICCKSQNLKLLNWSTYRSRDIQVHNTSYYSATSFIAILFAHQIQRIRFIEYQTEYINEHHA